MFAPSRISALAINALMPLAFFSLLAACGDTALFQPANDDSSAEPAAAEVRDASVFQKSGNALWDGRPSLGGVWIAHPDATTPERVEIRNDDTGRVIQAALFRRERDFPGPAFQLSSDAAVALQVQAGTPAAVTVTALRREAVEPPPEAEAVDAEQPPAEAADDATVIAADAAIDEALAAEAVPEGEIALDEVPAEEAAGGSAGSFLFGAKPQNTGVNDPLNEAPLAEIAEAEIAAEPLTPAEEDQAVLDGLEPAAAQPAAEIPDESAPGGGSAGSAPGNKPVLVDDAGEPIPLDDPSLQPITATEILSAPLPAAASDVAAGTGDVAEPEAMAETAAPPAAASGLERPFVQVASGSTRANVDELAAKLVQEGLAAAVRETSQEGKPLFYVVVGPYASQADLDAALARIRALGYSEAFIAKG